MRNSKSFIHWLDKNHLCLGCGLCEAIALKENIRMQLKDDGFYHPVQITVDKNHDKIIKKICPGLNVLNDKKSGYNNRIWGSVFGLYEGYSLDEEIRTKGSSGGMGSAVAIYTLENSPNSAVLQVGGDSMDFRNNLLKMSVTREDVLKCASSRYAPALIFNRIFELLETKKENFCFIGKPCDIAALNNFLNEFPQYINKIELTIGIMCAGMPSFNATDILIKNSRAEGPVTNLKYRGDGWPGNFSFLDRNAKKYEMNYNESWGGVLGRHIHQRCKICPDSIGLQSDITIGDAWETIDGYPDFTEREGKSLVIARTQKGLSYLNEMAENNTINLKPLTPEKLQTIQPYQFQRRKIVGARILAYSIARRRKLNFKNLFLFQNSIKENPIKLAREFLGSLKRFFKDAKTH